MHARISLFVKALSVYLLLNCCTFKVQLLYPILMRANSHMIFTWHCRMTLCRHRMTWPDANDLCLYTQISKSRVYIFHFAAHNLISEHLHSHIIVFSNIIKRLKPIYSTSFALNEISPPPRHWQLKYTDCELWNRQGNCANCDQTHTS